MENTVQMYYFAKIQIKHHPPEHQSQYSAKLLAKPYIRNYPTMH